MPTDAVQQGGFDGVVIASPSALHAEHARAALDTDATAVLVEKPLATSLADAEHLAREDGGRITVGYNLRLHPPVQRLRELITAGELGAVRQAELWFGSWLPSWRPGRDYRTTYSAQAALGGGILWDASHELDLLVWLLGGGWVVDHATLTQSGRLEIDVEDEVDARLSQADGATARVHLDYLSSTYQRGVEIIGTRGTARLDWATATLRVDTEGDRRTEPAPTTIDDSYRLEAAHFAGQCAGGALPLVTAAEGAATVALCEAVRAASEPLHG
jgi:predicted dehydrogenase